ncbi:ribonuclease III domain-containing protein [Methanolobus mangrovi]|uniref:Ribonuclease III domain-containing protein n=1 Tax=Methanolobus mangrovi TaxID=3072977 RepID=A0AA51UJT6_9EURY|nr:ribonuclease III domain-containing protein [Methanolobus mangrovi]WMW23006.1 ribonuclease III domain-containing protein [Methanolobus mangrovi]
MRVNEDLSVNANDLEEFQEIIGFRFKDKSYLIQALLHGSLFSGDKEKLSIFRKANNLENKDYEKLEYLGDSVLGLIIAEYAYHDTKVNDYAKSKGLTIEGVCTKIKVILASNENLKPVACKIKLSRFVLSEGHVNIDGKLADIIEALIGAIYLDGGYRNNIDDDSKDNTNHTNNTDTNYSITRDFVYRFFDIDSALEKISISNPKGIIQEMFHKNGLGNPFYKVIGEEGPDHDKHFTVGLYLDDDLLATGSADSKKKAEQTAADHYLRHLGKSSCP